VGNAKRIAGGGSGDYQVAMRYSLFTNDAGPDGYSCLCTINAISIAVARKQALVHIWKGEKGILIPLGTASRVPLDTGLKPPTSRQLLNIPGAVRV
jgi:hypothetical protein